MDEGGMSRNQFFNLRLTAAVTLLIVTTMIVFVIAHYLAWGTLPD
jgi:hypothetical protein